MSHSHFTDDKTKMQLKASQKSSRFKTQPKDPDSQVGVLTLYQSFYSDPVCLVGLKLTHAELAGLRAQSLGFWLLPYLWAPGLVKLLQAWISLFLRCKCS